MIARAALPVLLLLLAGSAVAASTPGATVIMLSWDGLRHDYPERVELPALARIITMGARAERLTAVFPSNTFPGHVSLATGTYPDRHGIVDNHFFDRVAGSYRMSADADWIEAEPLWIAAERQGVPAATYFWVGSESDWRGQGTRYRKTPFDGSRPEALKVDRILEWMALPEPERPRLIMSYWAGADSVGHRYGPYSAEVVAQLRRQDEQLGRLLAGLDRLQAWSYTSLLLVSDHGMARTGGYLDLRGTLARAGIDARVVGSATAQVFLTDPADRDRARVAIAELDPVRIHDGAALPDWMRLSHPTRTGDLVVVTEPPFSFSRPPGFQGRMMTLMNTLGIDFGGHGYDPRLPEMGGVFLAMGAGVPAGLALPEVHQTDVAATVAKLLGIDPPAQSEGRPVPGIGPPEGILRSDADGR